MSILFRGMVDGERRRQRRQLWFAWLVFGVAICSFGTLNVWLWTRFESRWERIRPGLTTEQIQASLGEPQRTQMARPRGADWFRAVDLALLGPRLQWIYGPSESDSGRKLTRIVQFRGDRVEATQKSNDDRRSADPDDDDAEISKGPFGED